MEERTMRTNATGGRRHSRTGARGARAADKAMQRMATDRGRSREAGFPLGELAERFSCILHGDAGVRVTRVATLQDADERAIAFVAHPKYLHLLPATRAAAVILTAENATRCRTSMLIARNPYATYARIAGLLHPTGEVEPGVRPSAMVDSGARVDPSASIGSGAIIEADVEIGANVVIGPHCIVMRGAS